MEAVALNVQPAGRRAVRAAESWQPDRQWR
jgi:hypothetical protein